MDKLRQELSTLHIEKALDIATRDGAFAKEMYAGFGSCKEIVALDRSDKMFEKGREKCAGMPVNFVIGDACHMDFEDNTFDVVGIDGRRISRVKVTVHPHHADTDAASL